MARVGFNAANLQDEIHPSWSQCRSLASDISAVSLFLSVSSELNLILIATIVHLCHFVAKLVLAISSSVSSVTGGGKTPLKGN